MNPSIENYIEIVGERVIASLHRKASRLYDKHILHLNSTFQGGGVAEVLSRLVPMMNDIGLDSGWRILHGNPAFFEVTKKLHNALQGADVTITEPEWRLYLDINEGFAAYSHLDHDCVFVHDPQPIPFIRFFQKRQPWVWRCHIDLSTPNTGIWDLLRKYLLRYDIVVFSSEHYRKPELPVDQRVISPAIDPLSLKNRDLDASEIARYIHDAGIPTDKPIITQVSRMDPWKDPLGVLSVYRLVREKIDCRLLFCYNLATDDPEGMRTYSQVLERARASAREDDILFVVGNNDNLVNAIQRFSSVILQKSLREGFCLTVTEALWKKKPVVASKVGGIPTQVSDGYNGFLVDPHDIAGCADRITELLSNPTLATRLGNNGHETVKEHFLTTRLMSDELDLMSELLRR